MKVLHLVKTSTGAIWAYRLMRELQSLGVDVHVAMPTDGELVPLYRETGITVHNINYNICNLAKTISQLRKIVFEVKPSLIHSHFVITTYLMRLGLKGSQIPRIFEVPGPLHLEHKFFRWLDKFLSDNNDYWVPTCKWSYRKYIEFGVNKNKIFLTYYGTDIKVSDSATGILRREIRASRDDIIVGMVAYMYAPKRYLLQKRGIKGHEDFIDAAKLLSDKYKNVKFVCIGGAWNNRIGYENQLKEYAKTRAVDISFLGTRNNVADLYKDIDIVVHPSLSENLGGAAESLMLGVPTVATNIGGFPDIVKHKETGFLVNPHSPNEIAEAVGLMIENYAQALKYAENGKNFVKNLLDIKTTAKEMLCIYDSILANVR